MLSMIAIKVVDSPDRDPGFGVQDCQAEVLPAAFPAIYEYGSLRWPSDREETGCLLCIIT